MDIEIKKKKTALKRWLKIGIPSAIGLAIVAWAAIRSSSSTYKADFNTITIGTVQKNRFNDYIHINGKVETGVVVHVSALETGIVERKWVDEGAMVHEGEIILTLRNPNLQEQILYSESQLAEKQNMLRDTEIAMERERLQVKQDLLTARIALVQKQRLFEQQEILYGEKLTSREEYLRAREDFDLARENFNLLLERQHQDSLYRKVQVQMMHESLDNMQQNMALVRQRADNLHIRATHTGQLGNLSAELGQNIPAGQQVGQINILDNFKITAQIDEHYIDRVSPGLIGKFDRRDKQYEIEVLKVYPEVTDNRFRADFAFRGDLPDKLRVGQTFSLDLSLGESSDAIIVERGTFFQSTGGKWAYVLSPDGTTAQKRLIRIGRQNPRYYEVLEGLVPGERIITSSYSRYGEADKIILNP